MRVHEIINEAFAPPVKWRWTGRSDFEYEAMFQIGKVTYNVSLFLFNSTINAWELNFSAKTNKEDFGYSVSNTGNAWKVLGTVIDIARQFIKLRKPNMIKIESDTTERSRLAVNRRIAAAIAQGTSYTVSMHHDEIQIKSPDDSTLTEAVKLRGMLAVKAALEHEPEDENRDDDEDNGEGRPINKWGIFGELWITEDGGLMLHRAITLKQPWGKHLKQRGHLYWSTSWGGAEPYNDMENRTGWVDIKITAELPSRANVDWFGLWESILELHHVGEDECRLDGGQRVIIRQISIGEMKVESPWIGKRLIA